MYEYKATLVKVVDGDTIDVMVDLGFDVHLVQRVRFARINCPEMSTPEGPVSKQFVIDYLVGKDVVIKTSKNTFDRYGRWIAEVFAGVDNLNDLLLQKGLAVPYPAPLHLV